MVKSISILKESKADSSGRKVENRVIFIPSQIKEIKAMFPEITVLVENEAGKEIDFKNDTYIQAGAEIGPHDEALQKEIVFGVKETKLEDFPRLKDNLFISYQHFAQSRERTEAALKSRATFVALETMEDKINGYPFFPCLAPMSESAAKIIARHADEYALLSKKIITSGLPETGLQGTKVVVLGGGSAGKTAAEEFSERGCEVILLEKNPSRTQFLSQYFKTNAIRFPKVKILEINPESLRMAIRNAFFLVSAMYSSARKPDKLVTLSLLKMMAPGGCVYPIDIDQGGGVEGIIETSILEPFNLPIIPGTEVFFFAPPNLPSIGARTTSEALGKVLLPYAQEIISKGLAKAAKENAVIESGINIKRGKLVHPGLASVFPLLSG